MTRTLMLALVVYCIVTTVIIVKDPNYKLLAATPRNYAHSDLNPQQNIIFNAIPKSGSEYIVKSLGDSLGYTFMHISAGYIPQDQINIMSLGQFYRQTGKISKQHFDASPLNIQVLTHCTNKVVLHLRDPRQILLSWVHHLNNMHAGQGIYFFYVEPPPSYFNLSLSEQIDWNIDHFLPDMVTWMQQWLALKDKTDNGLEILVTTYDEFIADETAFYAKIMQFYNIPPDRFAFKPAAKNSAVLFRKGDTEEWRTVFTTAQKERIAQIVPDDLLRRFNWEQ